MRDSLAEPIGSSTSSTSSSPPPRSIPPTLDRWLNDRAPEITAHWHGEVVRRGAVHDDDLIDLLERFHTFLTGLLPAAVGPDRGPALELWHEAASLYGDLGAVRGLAAGEVVDEFQILRESILREIFKEAPVGLRREVGLREAVQLNRVVDIGVTQSSVSQTDRLFYQLLEGNGVPSTTTPDLLAEIRGQLTGLEEEARAL